MLPFIALVLRLVLLTSVEPTTSSPFPELALILRFFALGGVDGGADATVAFFFPRGMTGKQELDLEVVVPILTIVGKDWGLVGEFWEEVV